MEGLKRSFAGFKVTYTAPTGKAAHVLRTRVGQSDAADVRVCTLHQVLAAARHRSPEVFAEHYGDADALVVDEFSMVPLEVFAKVLRLLSKRSTGRGISRVVLLGDMFQLPSIQAGDLMCDIYGAFKGYGFAHELLTNHRSEGHRIFNNADRIRRRQMPALDPANGFRLLTPSSLPLDVRTSHRLHVEKEDGMEEGKMETYRSLLWSEERRRECGLEDPANSQIIEFTNDACQVLNAYCVKIYNNHDMRDERGRLIFVAGDKIISKKNEWLNVEYLPPSGGGGGDPGDKDKRRFCNGEMFIIEKTEPNEMAVLRECGTQRRLRVDFRAFRRHCKPEHAYALTIHKCQGSEFDHVAYGLHKSGRWSHENWQHLYTAETRAKKSFTMIAESALQVRELLRRKDKLRITNLREKLQKEMEEWKDWDDQD